MYRKNLIKATGVLAIVALAGCASTPHNDVLIFGTETTLALDVGASATNGGTPKITVGYKRDEAVWMPLLANGISATPKPEAGQLYQGAGENGANKDAYSVFASFGAQLEGQAGSAKVGLAQFFATGIAAQKLASNPASVLALTVKSPEQGTADAKAVEQVANTQATNTLASQDKALSESLHTCMQSKGSDAFKTPPPGLNSIDQKDYVDSISKVGSASDIQKMIRQFSGFSASASTKAKQLGCTI